MKKNTVKYQLIALAAFALFLVCFNSSCKKDPVNPVNNEKPVDPKEELKRDSTNYANSLGRLKDIKFFKNSPNLYTNFWRYAVEPGEAKNFLDSVKGTNFSDNGISGFGYLRTAQGMKKVNNYLTKEEREILDTIEFLSARYLNLVEKKK